MKKTYIPLLLLLIGLCSNIAAQPLSDWIEAAEREFEEKDYYSAYKYYEVVLLHDTTRMDYRYRLGESAQNFTAYRTAEEAYRLVAVSEVADTFPLLLFNLAEVMHRQGKYADAAAMYDRFITEQPEAPADIIKIAEQNLDAAEWAQVMKENRREDIIVQHVNGDVNSPNSDFGPYYRNDTLYFSSLRFPLKKDSLEPRRDVTHILRQNLSNTEIAPEELPEEINGKGQLNAHTTFSADGQTMYFTRCDYLNASIDMHCEIYRSRMDAKGKWETPVRLPINDASYTTTQPNVGEDPDTGKPYLYFTSDRAGGKGGLDLYRSEILENEQYGPVENLSAFNTAANDVTPFYYAPTQVFYFSSDGRQSMGGYDIYRSSWDGRNWGQPTNMGVPVNTSYNDWYYARFEDSEMAYLASNRPDSAAIFWDETKDACCNDIYKIGIADEVKLLVLTFDDRDKTELIGTSVALFEITPDGGRRLVDTLYNPVGHDFNFTIQPGKKYELVGRKPGYSIAIDALDMLDPELVNQHEITRKLYLAPELDLDVFTYELPDSTDLIGTTLDLFELTPEGEMITVATEINPLANDYHFSLERGKKYLIRARKEGYTPAEEIIDTNDPEFAQVSRIRRDLYLKPGLVLEVYTFRLRDKKPLLGANVRLYSYTDEEGEELIDSLVHESSNLFWWPVEKGKRYVIRGEREGYGPDDASLDLTVPDVPERKTYRRDLYLGQRLEIYTFNAETKEPLPGAEIKLINPNTGEVLADRINPLANDFVFSIEYNTPYRIEVTRKGFEPVTELITFTPEMANKEGVIVLDIELVPIDDPASLLPILLYYDNDHPNPRSRSPITTLEYVTTNQEYYKRKQKFISSFTKGLELEEAFRVRRRFQDFFDREVRGGRYNLEEFAQRTLAYLEGGGRFVMDLQGFASPRAAKAYNDILSARRIDAVKNFFERYENGAFRSYMASGALTFIEKAYGETRVDPRALELDESAGERRSVYDILASLERRVEIRDGRSENQ